MGRSDARLRPLKVCRVYYNCLIACHYPPLSQAVFLLQNHSLVILFELHHTVLQGATFPVVNAAGAESKSKSLQTFAFRLKQASSLSGFIAAVNEYKVPPEVRR